MDRHQRCNLLNEMFCSQRIVLGEGKWKFVEMRDVFHVFF